MNNGCISILRHCFLLALHFLVFENTPVRMGTIDRHAAMLAPLLAFDRRQDVFRIAANRQ